ncbi:MAG: ECF-type sigma factor [Acidobacteriota bacterium]
MAESRPNDTTETTLTDLLRAWSEEHDGSADRLLERVHHELRRVARRAMRGERPEHTLQPTALVHEAYLRLAANRPEWNDRRHFFAVAATLMRRILVDHARTRGRDKRGANAAQVELLEVDAEAGGTETSVIDLLVLDRALEKLAAVAPGAAQMLELKYFGGLTYEEIVDVLGVSRPVVGRELRFAKAWLRRHLGSDG